MSGIITLILVSLSVGLGNFAVSIAIGLGGVSKALRFRIALVFGIFETGMPILGLLLGQKIASRLGGHANIIGGILLVIAGIYFVVSSWLKTDEKDVLVAEQGWGKLLISGLSLSIDNLIIGFGLGTRHQSIILDVTVIGTVSVCLSLVGLEIGKKLNSRVEEYSEILSGLILVLVGALLTFNVL